MCSRLSRRAGGIERSQLSDKPDSELGLGHSRSRQASRTQACDASCDAGSMTSPEAR